MVAIIAERNKQIPNTITKFEQIGSVRDVIGPVHHRIARCGHGVVAGSALNCDLTSVSSSPARVTVTTTTIIRETNKI